MKIYLNVIVKCNKNAHKVILFFSYWQLLVENKTDAAGTLSTFISRSSFLSFQ